MAAAFLVGLALVAVVVRAFTLRTVEVVTPYQQTQGRIAARLAPPTQPPPRRSEAQSYWLADQPHDSHWRVRPVQRRAEVEDDATVGVHALSFDEKPLAKLSDALVRH